jgi:hypothetical protein
MMRNFEILYTILQFIACMALGIASLNEWIDNGEWPRSKTQLGTRQTSFDHHSNITVSQLEDDIQTLSTCFTLDIFCSCP